MKSFMAVGESTRNPFLCAEQSANLRRRPLPKLRHAGRSAETGLIAVTVMPPRPKARVAKELKLPVVDLIVGVLGDHGRVLFNRVRIKGPC
jgi:hypothetical protein